MLALVRTRSGATCKDVLQMGAPFFDVKTGITMYRIQIFGILLRTAAL